MNKERLENLLLVFLAFAFPWYHKVDLSVGKINLSLADPVIILIACLLLVGIMSLEEFPSFTKEIFYLVAISSFSLFFAAIRYPVVTNLGTGATELIKLIASVAYFFAIIVLTQKDGRKRIYVFALSTVLFASFISLWTTVETLSGVYRPSGPFNNPNLYSNYLLFSIFMLFLLIGRMNPPKYQYQFTFLILPLFPIGISLLGTQSRSVIGAFFVGIVFLLLVNTGILKNASRILYTRPMATVLGLTIVGLLFFRDWEVIYRFQKLMEGKTTGGRFNRWAESSEVFLDSSYLGIGWGQHPQYISGAHTLHNTIIQVTVEAGLIGGVLLILLWVNTVRRGIQLSKTYRYRHAVYVTAFLVAAIANSMFHNNLNFRTYWIALGLLGALELDYWGEN